MDSSLTPERLERVSQIFHDTLERPTQARAAFLDAACAGDASLRAEVESLLLADARPDSVLEAVRDGAAVDWLQGQATEVPAGQRIGSYLIERLVGRGGMGRVYLARDEHLQRPVALKLLSEEAAARPDRIRRFSEEARAISHLNHPHILTIFDAGVVDGQWFIATEFVEGETLRARLRRGPLAWQEVLRIASQMAAALGAAHAAGIIHRDVKPENVMIRPDGYVKVLDFGLAKLVARSSDSGQSAETQTRTGTVLGTTGYMSPEQLRGEPLDLRSDIFSFGVVLYEMITGIQPFKRRTDAAAAGAVAYETPPTPDAHRKDVPARLAALVMRAIQKDREKRFASIADLQSGLESVSDESSAGHRISIAAGSARRRWLAAAATLVMLVAAVIVVQRFALSSPATDRVPSFGAASFRALSTDSGAELSPSLSPDGRTLLFAKQEGGTWDIHQLALDKSDAAPLNLTRGSGANNTHPAFSPDGKTIAFRSERSGGGIFIMNADGSGLRRISDTGYFPAWSPDGQQIAFTIADVTEPSVRSIVPSALWVVSVRNAERRMITIGDAVQAAWSPDGTRLAYWGLAKGGQRDIFVAPVVGGTPVQITDDEALDWKPIWAPDGQALFFLSDRGGAMNLWRVLMGPAKGRARGEPQPITVPATYVQDFALSRDGTQFVYVKSETTVNIAHYRLEPKSLRVVGDPTWITRGALQARNVQVSPDGRWLAYDTTGAEQEDLFIIPADGSASAPRRLTNDAFNDRGPNWSPDGRRLAFLSDRGGRYDVWIISTDGSGLKQVSVPGGDEPQTPAWAPDGRHIVYARRGGSPAIVDADAGGEESVIEELPPPPDLGQFYYVTSWSPDGRMLLGYQRPTDILGSGIWSYSFDAHAYGLLSPVGETPRWLADSQRALFLEGSGVFVIDGLDRQVQKILDVSPLRMQNFAVSRDQRSLYVSALAREADLAVASLPPDRPMR